MGGPAKARPRSRVPRESPQAQWKGAAAVETARPQRQRRWLEGGPSVAGSGAEEEGGEGGGRRWGVSGGGAGGKWRRGCWRGGGCGGGGGRNRAWRRLRSRGCDGPTGSGGCRSRSGRRIEGWFGLA